MDPMKETEGKLRERTEKDQNFERLLEQASRSHEKEQSFERLLDLASRSQRLMEEEARSRKKRPEE
jgi:hypothetical protein